MLFFKEKWKEELAKSVDSFSKISKQIELSDSEKKWFTLPNKNLLNFRVTPLFLKLIKKNSTNKNYPLRIQAIPRIDEKNSLPYEEMDPLFEKEYSPLPRLIHRYPSRIVILATDQCAMYCRHCFRRHHTSHNSTQITDELIEKYKEYIIKNPEITEVLISGGDPLIQGDKNIKRLLKGIRAAKKELTIRIGTRAPIVLPSRITKSLLKILKKSGPIWIVTQFNHPDEFSPQTIKAINKLVKNGIPLLNQTVLLRGVNNDVETLKSLNNLLVLYRIKPYYLFQGDLATGTAHLRVPLKKGLEITKKLRQELSGMAMPVYAVDLPKGGGKIPLTESYLFDKDEKNFIFKDYKDKKYFYPNEL